MFSKLITGALALSLAATMAMAADGVRFNVIKDVMLKDAPKEEKSVSQAEKNYMDMMHNDIKGIGFILSDPHQRINDGYATKYGGTNLDNLGFFSITADKALRPLLIKEPDLGGFSPFNLHIYKVKGEDVTRVGHITPTTMLDIVGVQDKAVRSEFVKIFEPLDALVDKKLGGKVEMVQYDKLTADPMMHFEVTFKRPEYLGDFVDTFQEKFELAVEDKDYIIAGYKNYREAYNDLGLDFSKYDAYFVYSLCHFTFSNGVFNLVDGQEGQARPDAGAFAPCSMYMYIEKGSNKLIIGMPKLENWIAVMNVKDKKMVDSIHALDKEIISIMEELGAKSI
ncbi:MAG: hypothetical protein PF439_05050 [Helicobacteraceae bacterium]|jgi:uncharacterized protein (DUF302 family)|nr:hypothetical protein [Helicobacteraceae bacterium]